MTTDRFETEIADDVNLDDIQGGTEPTFVARLIEIALTRRGDRTMLHTAWEPLSFQQEFSRDTYPFREDDYSHDWLTAVTKDGRAMGPTTMFGRVKAGFEALGYKLARNEVFRSALEGKVFMVKRFMDEWGDPDPATGRRRRSFALIPIEELAAYAMPADRKKVRYGFKDSVAQAAVTPEQIQALKAATNGTAPTDFVNAIIDSGEDSINRDPFLAEASGDGERLLERLKGFGAQVINGRVFFAELS